MKTTITKIKYVSMMLFFIFATACSSDDDSGTNIPGATVPTVNYANSTLDAVFFEAGNSAAPDITWNGSVGAFSLATPLDGLSINANTGVLSWTKLLPQGNHTIQVIIANSTGQKSINLILQNKFQGNFTYRFEGTCSYELHFSADGSLGVKYIRGVDILANGSWEINGNELTASYTFINDNEENSIRALLVHTTTEVKLEGNWYNGLGAISGQEGGSINLKLGELPAGDGIISLRDNSGYIVLFYDSCGAACCFSTVQDAKDAYPSRTLTFVP